MNHLGWRLWLTCACLLSPGLSFGATVSGTLATDTTWRSVDSPVVVTGDVTVSAAATLRIEPGVEVQVGAGRSLIFQGTLMALGTESERIRFVRRPGSGAWGRLDFHTNSRESQIAFADVDGAGSAGNVRADKTKVRLSHVRFLNTTVQLVTLDESSCVIEGCEFPSIQNNELLHFFRMPTDGYALIVSNRFGTPGIPATSGYNDIIDFTGGNRPGPIAEFIGNTFLSSVDDCFDMDGTDAHIEGNMFINVRQEATRASTSNPITTGEDNFGKGDTSQLVICRNIIYDSEHMLLLKERGSAVLQNNTVVKLRNNPLAAQPSCVILFGEPHRGTAPGAGAVVEGMIAWDLETEPFHLFNPTNMFLSVNHSLLQGTNWPGVGNLSVDPGFISTVGVDYLNIRSKLSLREDSPARGTGPNGLDMGALVPGGASISGEPDAVTTNRLAELKVAGPGIFAYKWRLNDGPWSDEVRLTTNILFTADMFRDAPPIRLGELSPGIYTVSVLGRNSAGRWQDEAHPTLSRTWTVVGVGAGLKVELIQRVPEGVEVLFPGEAGQTYVLESLEEVSGLEWTERGRVTGPQTGSQTLRVVDETPKGRQRFYRIRVL